MKPKFTKEQIFSMLKQEIEDGHIDPMHTIRSLNKQNDKLVEALSKMVGTSQPINDMQWQAYNEAKSILAEVENG